jgi:coenzyme F420-reducing hydrogenase beta subunit
MLRGMDSNDTNTEIQRCTRHSNVAMGIRNVLNEVVAVGLCSGCGVCAALCPVRTLRMGFNAAGEIAPTDGTKCLPRCTICLDVCPLFDCSADATAIAHGLFQDVAGNHHDPVLGYHLGAYVGHVTDEIQRLNGASGGIASWFLAQLLRSDLVDRVIAVRATEAHGKLFEYCVCDSPAAVLRASKSAYYPVELSDVLRVVIGNPGRYAVVGLPCFVTGLRLAARRDKRLKERLRVHVGLVCGQQKSAAFTNYLVSRMGLDPRQVNKVCFRGKDPARTACEHTVLTASDGVRAASSYGCDGVHEVFRTGQFKLPACNYCDDVFSELADVVFMDAWLPPYMFDGRGTNIVVTRSPLAESVLKDGAAQGRLSLARVAANRVVESQEGRVKDKRESLSHRLWLDWRGGRRMARRRVAPAKPGIIERIALRRMDSIGSASRLAALEASGGGPKEWLDASTRYITPELRRNANFTKALRIGLKLLQAARKLRTSLHDIVLKRDFLSPAGSKANNEHPR